MKYCSLFSKKSYRYGVCTIAASETFIIRTQDEKCGTVVKILPDKSDEMDEWVGWLGIWGYKIRRHIGGVGWVKTG